MATEREVIREFLVSLGYQVDTYSAKRFVGSLLGVTKMAGAAGTAVTAVAAAAEVMVQKFARGMEQLYYASRRTQATVENIKAVEYAARQVGVSSDTMRGSLESFSRALRTNPGLTGLLKQLGVKSDGRDRVQVLNDLVQRISKMPHYVGAQYAELFGMDEQTFLMLKDKLPEFLAAQERYLALQKASGVNAQQAAEAGREYMNMLRELWERVQLLADGIAVKLLPAFREFMGVVNEVLKDVQTFATTDFDIGDWGKQIRDITDDLRKLDQQLNMFEHAKALIWLVKNETIAAARAVASLAGMVTAMLAGNRAKAQEKFQELNSWLWGGSGALSGRTESPAEKAANASLRNQGGGPSVSGAVRPAPSAASSNSGAAALFNDLEKKYALPSGILDSMWQQESGRGQNMIGRMTKYGRATGHFQFLKGTADQYGVGDTFDLAQSATGAAKYMANLMRMFGGDTASALAGYNWGEGNLQKFGMGSAPAETRNYVSEIMGRMSGGSNVTLNQTTNINVSGSDPAATGRAVGNEQRRVNGDIVRNLSTNMR